uniref:Serine carboxypeptidase-like 19 n=1 Tax=Leersia perrieri TaxID=77586 RepID=A0A0D9XQV2_9ORYZ
MSLHLLLLLLLLLSFFHSGIAAATDKPPRTHVTSLPGFDGALPFRLETGYVTVDEENGAELFYYFIESEGDPSTDPVLLWLTGGHRCSVLSALFFEIGPVKLVIEPYNGGLPRLRYHPYSWTKVASIIFVDSPVGAGFSFSRDTKGYDVGDVSCSLQIVKFLGKWFGDHPEYLANPFYVGGDSRAGLFAPFIAQKISQDIEAGVRPALNLKGYIVGNPVTGERIDYESKVPYCHGVGIISDQLYEMIMEHCKGEDYHNPKNVICKQALARFNTIYSNYLSYFWANNNVTRETLGIKKGSVDEWVRCHDNDLPYTKDIKSSIKYHQNLTLNADVSLGFTVPDRTESDVGGSAQPCESPCVKQRPQASLSGTHRSEDARPRGDAPVAFGDHDSVIPFLGTQTWVRSLNYPILDDWRTWHVDGQSAGVVDILHQSISQRDA